MAKGYLEALRRPQTKGTFREGGIDAHKTIESAKAAVNAAQDKPGEGSSRPKPTPMNKGFS